MNYLVENEQKHTTIMPNVGQEVEKTRALQEVQAAIFMARQFPRDETRAYKKVLEYGQQHKFRYKSFNVGTSTATSVRDFITEIKKLSNSPTKLNFGAIPYREDEIMLSVADNTELCDLGWKPDYSLQEGILKTIRETVL